MSSETGHIALPLEVPLAASRSYSGRRSVAVTDVVKGAMPDTIESLSGKTASPGFSETPPDSPTARTAPLVPAPAPAAEKRPAKLASKLRSFKPSIRRRILEATVSTGSAAVPAPAVPAQTLGDSSSPHVAGSGGDSDGTGGGPSTSGKAPQVEEAFTDAPAAALEGQQPIMADASLHSPFQAPQPQQEQLQQLMQCRFASTSALSAMAVSKAVHRLQLRQQQEKAAARYARTAPHIPNVSGSGLHHQYASPPPHQREPAAAASTQRVLSVASDGSSSSGCGGSAAAVAVESNESGMYLPYGSSMGALPQSHPPLQQGYSPARRLGFGMNQSRSASSNFAFQKAQYDGHRNAPAGAADGGDAAPDSGRTSTAQATNADFDEWLGADVPDMSRGRLTRVVPTDLDRRSSMSYTEGHISAAERLQAMVSSAASAGGDEAASYLQQLLIPDMSSTASVDLHYSNNSNPVASVVTLAYGSSSGPAAASAMATPVPGAGGLWGLLQNSNSPLAFSASEDTGGFLRTSPATPTVTSKIAAAAAAMGCGSSGSAHVRPLSAQGHWLNGDRVPRSSTGCGSGHLSRQGSVTFTSQSAHFGAAPSHSSVVVGGANGSVTSGSGTSLMLELPTSSSCPHVNKTATQLVEELRELHATAVAAEPQPPTPQQQQLLLRDELTAALWRLLRAKDSEAVSYLLAVDPASKPNRLIAPMLAEMRSWVYLNMW
ncbi:hypothetical protein VOLCADRAFT_87354 [Volvox carteri f. nagariensis]|uniref:Uncharacterized protein n=1 Tax=Volvox carteri f. nagariensis TaxID=3068 RepID=D8TL48_VOLCA|nr:uncharacterized protein VOLCADRAFT_87354 [Volvox carteri f. nagariensis]EFJ51808.1 hypothetical protein VOLCADRAFT_87354 [Volvox carteri f. nagariensis]|eukprot:XP_002947218.1 hypothetical protein VOLCADRAFT_87354 [Volvox carteri f. nagariensis]